MQQADVAVVGLLTDEFDDIRLMTSRAMLRSSLTLLTSHRDMTLHDVLNDTSVILVIVSHSRAERLLRRSREPVQRALWRRISGRVKQSRSRSGQSQQRQRGRRTSRSRVVTLDAGVSRVLDAAVDDDDDFVLVVESTDAAYVSSRHPGCTLTVTDQSVTVAEYRFVVDVTSNSSSSSWRRHLLQRLDSSLAALQQAAVIKRLYYKWWTSTDCLTHFTDPDVWTLSVDGDATDVDETSDDERIFLQAPMSAMMAEPSPRSMTHRQLGSTRVNDDELDRGEVLASELDKHSPVSQRPVRGQVDVITTAGSRDTIADKCHRQRHTQSSTPTTTTLTSWPITTTTTTMTTTTTTWLPQRSHRKPEEDTGDRRYIDRGQRNDDDFDVIANTKHTADKDQFDYVLMRHGALSVHVEDHHADNDDVENVDGLVSEQEMAVKEHWRRGGDAALAGEVRQSTSTTMKTASHSRQWTSEPGGSDDSSVLSPPSVTLLLVVASVAQRASISRR